MKRQWHESPLVQLCLTRLREFIRHPDVLFWTYGFPLLMLLAMGLAFRSTSLAPIAIEVIGPRAETVAASLNHPPAILAIAGSDDTWRKRLQSGKANVVVVTYLDERRFEFWTEPARVESQLARATVESTLLKGQIASNPLEIVNNHLQEVGSRYIDFFVPGMLALNLMGGGLWGVGFVIVDMRIRKLLKRLMATPMQRWHFLMSILIVRLLFSVCEVSVILLFSYAVFGVVCQGSILELIAVMGIGGATFGGIGLLLASRVKSNEAIGGLMNLIMLPMWIVGGVFFSSERFPDQIQPVLKSLPFVALVDSLRSIMMDGASITTLGIPILVMSVWGIACAVVALRVFRWR
jgi:ABC-2 type transport system permease protein